MGTSLKSSYSSDMLWLFDKGRDDGMCQKNTESRRTASVWGLFGSFGITQGETKNLQGKQTFREDWGKQHLSSCLSRVTFKFKVTI